MEHRQDEVNDRKFCRRFHWKRWTIGVLIGIGIYVLSTGGICFFDRTNFGNEVRLDFENLPLSRIDVDPRKTEFHIPLLFHYYGFKRPYRLTMYVFDKKKSFDRIELSEVRLVLENGEVVKGMQNWRRDIGKEDWYGGEITGGVWMAHQVLEISLPNAVPFSIISKGKLRKKGGEFVSFNQKAIYRVRPATTVVPYWFVLYAYTRV